MSLRIAFFGTDIFSTASLARVRQLQCQNPRLIESIHLITRSIKPKGRHLKNFADVPAADYANENNIPIFRADTSTQIFDFAKRSFNLAIAVSYGKLIPADFIHAMKYGGLNVHPSLLPMFRGSSPIQYALLNDCKATGVSVQTLHPTKFDHGSIISQSDPIPIGDCDNTQSLTESLAEKGASLLSDVLEKRLFLDPKPLAPTYQPSLAPKILPSLAQILWSSASSRSIKRLNDALGPLHTYKEVKITKKRKQIHELQKVILSELSFQLEAPPGLTSPGQFKLISGKLAVRTIDGVMMVGKLKFQYCAEEDPITFFNLLRKRSGETQHIFLTK